MRKILTTLFMTFSILLSSQESQQEKAIKSFETYFLKSCNPADRNHYSFKNYSELFPITDFPKELINMANYDSTKFYKTYLYSIKYLRDTLIKISELDLDSNILGIYTRFKKSILDGEKQGKFNCAQDKLYSIQLKQAMKNSVKPKIGYSQIVTVIVETPDGKKEEQERLIKYNNNLEIISFTKGEKVAEPDELIH